MNEITFNTQIDLAVLEKEIVINSQEDYTQAGDVLKLCKNKVKQVDEERKEYTKPLDDTKKKIMDKAKEITEPLMAYIKKIESAMGTWYIGEEKRRQEEQKRLDEEALANAGDNPDVEVAVVESAKTTRGNVATSSAIEYNDYKVEDLNKVPREYLMLDDSKVKLAVKAGVEIAGIKIVKKVRIASR